MLLNAETAISTSTVLLVPYSKWHVPRYHEWMKDEEIQEATASEPLSIEEEYTMQQSWRQDPDKLTFIVCLPTPSAQQAQGIPDPLSAEDDSPERMVGDINLFLRVDDGEEGDSDPQIIGEIELMIAEKKNQRKGFGRAALLAFLRYIVDHEKDILTEFVNRDTMASELLSTRASAAWKFSCLSVKIGQANVRSLALFESVRFAKVADEPNYFGEFELRRTDLGREWIDEAHGRAGVNGYAVLSYGRKN
ncbi:GNAT domain-containing protein [Aspergillus ambiguus]|uniref:uncharacterized protein n=1 Tax=Aspergillus ambiguus TaxID=176160 RepID=UPI003CCDC17E